MKCPNCGAPISGQTCAYCGSEHAASYAPPAPLQVRETAIRGKRNVLDWILIFFGSVWCFIILAVVMDLGYWRPAELIAALMAASPGIVLLLIGCRRKKPKRKEDGKRDR